MRAMRLLQQHIIDGDFAKSLTTMAKRESRSAARRLASRWSSPTPETP